MSTRTQDRLRPRHRAAIGLGLLSAGASHVVYPAALWALARRRQAAVPVEPVVWPSVTVVVPAFKEAGIIAVKVADVLANGYPGRLEVLVVADDAETAEAASACGAKVLEAGERLGKSRAINAAMEAVHSEVAVLTDANSSLVPGSLRALVRHFGDPCIGAVAGEKVEADSGGEEVYWRFESWLKRQEWRLGTTLGVTGELVGVRRSAWEPIPADVSSDDLWIALDLNDRGHVIAYESEARSIDPPTAPGRALWERRTRIVAAAVPIYWRKRRMLLPRNGVVALQLIGHGFWRHTGGPLSHLGLLVAAAGPLRARPVARLFIGSHLVGIGTVVWRASGRRLPWPLGAMAQALYLQGVALGGLLRTVRGDRLLTWPKPER